MPATTLSDTELTILDVERGRWEFAGAKEQAIRERLDMTVFRYYQQLNALIGREDVLAFDPLLVKRLRRIRAQRQRTQSARRLRGDL